MLRLRQLEKSLLSALNESKGRLLDDDRYVTPHTHTCRKVWCKEADWLCQIGKISLQKWWCIILSFNHIRSHYHGFQSCEPLSIAVKVRLQPNCAKYLPIVWHYSWFAWMVVKAFSCLNYNMIITEYRQICCESGLHLDYHYVDSINQWLPCLLPSKVFLWWQSC